MAVRLEDVRVEFRDPDGRMHTVLDVAKLSIADGEQRCITGGSGTGKTTLLNCLAGIVVPSSGGVFHDDVDITRMSEPQRDRFRASRIGYVFQTFNLLRGLTCVENVALAGTLAGRSRAEASEQARSLLDRVGLSRRSDAQARKLSVGEQQRVAIARALINRPKVVLADEPTANLDEVASDVVLDLLMEITAELGSILVLVTHEARVRDRFEYVVPLAELTA